MMSIRVVVWMDLTISCSTGTSRSAAIVGAYASMTMSRTRCPVHRTGRCAVSGSERAWAVVSCAPAANGRSSPVRDAMAQISARRVARTGALKKLLAHATLQLFELSRRVGFVIGATACTRQAVYFVAQRLAFGPAIQLGLDLVHGGVHGSGAAALPRERDAARRCSQLIHHLSD